MTTKERLEFIRPYAPPVVVRREDAISALEVVPNPAVRSICRPRWYLEHSWRVVGDGVVNDAVDNPDGGLVALFPRMTLMDQLPL